MEPSLAAAAPVTLAREHARGLGEPLHLLQGDHRIGAQRARVAVERDRVLASLAHHEQLLAGKDEDRLGVACAAGKPEEEALGRHRARPRVGLGRAQHDQRVALGVVVPNVGEIEAAPLRAGRRREVFGIICALPGDLDPAEHRTGGVDRPEHGLWIVRVRPVHAGGAEAHRHAARLVQLAGERTRRLGHLAAGTRSAPPAAAGQHRGRKGEPLHFALTAGLTA